MTGGVIFEVFFPYKYTYIKMFLGGVNKIWLGGRSYEKYDWGVGKKNKMYGGRRRKK